MAEAALKEGRFSFMKGFGIYVKNDLLEPKHVKNMGNAIWLYLWLLDKMTSISEAGVGKVLGGKAIRYEDVYKDVPIPVRNYRRYIHDLREHGYINTTQTPYGLAISINKAFKPFRSAKNGTPKTHREVPKMHSDVPKVTYRSAKNGTPNIDNTMTIQDNRGIDSKNKEKIRQALKTNDLALLK